MFSLVLIFINSLNKKINIYKLECLFQQKKKLECIFFFKESWSVCCFFLQMSAKVINRVKKNMGNWKSRKLCRKNRKTFFSLVTKLPFYLKLIRIKIKWCFSKI